MATPQFRHFDLRIVVPDYSSSLTDVIMELQYLKRIRLGGSTPAPIFFQLKNIFHLLESLGSARIEGNRTTVAEMIEARIDQKAEKTDNIREIENMEEAMTFIDEAVELSGGISKAFIHELHKKTVRHLKVEGDRTPGYFRKTNVDITGSSHKPPDYMQVEGYMDELIKFINDVNDPKYDLLKIALAHHRFAWVHPYSNGNGRVVRLLTYAMLIEKGFNVKQGRILNPSAVFCNDRGTYYSMLSLADNGDDAGLLAWCEYVLKGLLDELVKIDKLADYNYLSKNILKPAINFILKRENITNLESKILNVAIQKTIFQSSDIEALMPDKLPAERSRVLSRLKENNLIQPISENARKYVVSFSNSYLLRGIIKVLGEEDFISVKD